jgi:F420H(2)-dependent quinone reductase
MPLKGEYEPNRDREVREQVERYESSGGTEATTLGAVFAGVPAHLRDLPVVILTTLGARSGKVRKTPLMRVEHDGSYAIVASHGGAPKHPVWYYNVKADPEVQLQDGATKKAYVAHEAAGEERELWWDRAVRAWPDYANYQKKTDRVIPLFVLTPR